MKFTRIVALLTAAAPTLALAQSAPQYTIQDLGIVSPFYASQGFGISSSGNYGIGRSIYLDPNTIGSYWPGTLYDQSTGALTALQGVDSSHPWVWSYGVNNSGVAVGKSANATSGSGAIATVWQGGVATQLAMPAGQTVSRAYDVNNNNIAVGSVGSGVSEMAVVYDINANKSTVLYSAMSSQGSYMQTAFGISDNGLVVGAGVTLGSLNVPVVYNMNTGALVELSMPAYAGTNSAGAYDISANGQYIVGTAGNSSQAVLWALDAQGHWNLSQATLPAISSSGSMSGVNDEGWAVGNSGGVYSNPFLFANGQTYLMSDLLTNGVGWNFSTTTSASASDIANDGTIIGTAQLNGVEHMYRATLVSAVPEPGTYALMLGGLLAVGAVARRRRRPT